jgi:farnesyl diphosphate synthase
LPFQSALGRAQDWVETILLGPQGQLQPDINDLTDAMRHALQGGKGLRAFLVIESARLHGIDRQRAAGVGAAIECVHAYSLIHDDLPCMDDDDLRRGQPTVHRKWDEATAVLAGDALQTLAFDLLCHPTVGDAATQVRMVQSLAGAAGHRGMVGGQMLDMAAEKLGRPATLDEITELQKGKTGALIEWSAMAGAMMADADPEPLKRYGQNIGLAFQIADDILDVESDAATLGKATGKDADAGKATFVSLLGLDGAKSRAQELVQSACDCLSVYGENADTLRECAQFVITRKN